MLSLYALALIPMAIGAVLWIRHSEIVWWEWIAGSLLALATCGLLHAITWFALTADIETHSSFLASIRHQPKWVEIKRVAVHSTDSKGHTHTRYETRYTTHPERWYGTAYAWDGEREIDRQMFYIVAKSWGGLKPVRGSRPGYSSGDRNDYVAHAIPQAAYPVTAPHSWRNPLKSSSTILDFAKVSEEEAQALGLYPWPDNPDPWHSQRLLGHNGAITRHALDALNADLGPKKDLNLILIGFGERPQSTATYQQAYWHGGKRSDLVICHGHGWAYAFGWATDAKLYREIESLVLAYQQAHGTLDDGFLTDLRPILYHGYAQQDFAEFSYLQLSPPAWAYLALLAVMAATQTAFYIYAHQNEHTQVQTYRHGGYVPARR